VVSLPLVGLVRSAEGYPLLAGSTGYTAIHPPGFGGYTCRKNTGMFSGRILQPEMAACENLPPAAFLQRNMEEPCSFIVQRYAQEGDDRYRNLPHVSKSGQPWRSPLRCRRFRLFKLQPHVQ